MPTLIIVADGAMDAPVALIQRIGWALLDAETAETGGTRRPSCP